MVNGDKYSGVHNNLNRSSTSAERKSPQSSRASSAFRCNSKKSVKVRS